MPSVTHLFNQHIEVLHRREPVAGEGGTSVEDVYELVFTDRASGDQVRIRFGKETRDQIAQQLSGISIATAMPPRLT